MALQALIAAQTPEQAEEAEKRKRAQLIKDKELNLVGCRIPGFFPTPPAVISLMLEEANIQPGDQILEPSAGTGNLADAARDAGGEVVCVECQYSLAEILELKGHNTRRADFLTENFWPLPGFDKILMNPPFEKGQDAEHVRRAFGFLKPGGRLVAIMSEGTFFRSDSQAEEFRAWLRDVEGRSERLPEGSFKNTGEVSQTGTAARIVVISK
ncbi:hypothetical protein CCP3SC1AL1_1690001 [Gammaproteobacteria bacterium]